MPFQLDHLQRSLDGTGVRRLALACNLLLLGWIAWTIAQPILPWLQPDTDARMAAVQEEPIAQTPESDRREHFDIAGWHLFGVPSTQPAKVMPEKVNAPETRLNLELNGVYLDDQPGNSRAIISEKGKQQEHFKVGDSLPGNAVLDEIHAEYVLLERNGRYERLALSEKTSTGSNDYSGVTNPASRQTGRRTPQPAIAAPEVEVEPEEAEAASPPLRLRPVVSEGTFQGMSISAGSAEGRHLLEKADTSILPRDVITSINGIEIHTAEDGMSLLEDYTGTERLDLVIKRGDESIPVVIDPNVGN